MALTKGKKRLTLFILFVVGSVLGSTISLDLKNQIGRNEYQNSLFSKKIDKFLYSIGDDGDPNSSSSLKPEDLVKTLSSNPYSIPILINGFSVIIAKSIFDGSFFDEEKNPKPAAASASAKKNGEELKKLKEVFDKNLKETNDTIKKNIEKKQSDLDRIKDRWITDDEEYLTTLRDIILGKIDENSIDNYLDNSETGDHKLEVKKNPTTNGQDDKTFPLIDFLLKKWLELSKAGYYVHQHIPYSSKFSDKMRKLYEELYPDVQLPEKPDYYFPDIEENKNSESIKNWSDAIDGWNKQAQSSTEKSIPETVSLEWISDKNSPQKNWALAFLSSETKGEVENSRVVQPTSWDIFSKLGGVIDDLLREIKQITQPIVNILKGNHCDKANKEVKDEKIPTFNNQIYYGPKENPLEIFCLSSSNKSLKEKGYPEFLKFASQSSEKKEENAQTPSSIVFYRDKRGLNLIYPAEQSWIKEIKDKSLQPTTEEKVHKRARREITQNGVEQSQTTTKGAEESKKINENLVSNRRQLTQNFKNYISENFSFLLLEFYKSKKHLSCSNGGTNSINGEKDCKELIDLIIEIWQSNQELSNWGRLLENYDSRTKNSSTLRTTETKNYTQKLGTISPTPPKFLEKAKNSNKEIEKKLKELMKNYKNRIDKFFEVYEKKLTSQRQARTRRGTNETEEIKREHWSFIGNSNSQQKSLKDRMKEQLAEYLFEQISSKKWLNKFLLLPTAFEGSLEMLNESSKQKLTSKQPDFTKTLNKELISFLGLSNSTVQQASKDQNSAKKRDLITLLRENIQEELILSKIPTLSETTLLKLSKASENSGTSTSGTQLGNQNSDIDWETIESYFSISQLSEKSLSTGNKVEINEKLRVLVTSLYLLENSFKEYRELLKRHIRKNFFGTYIFSLSWNKSCNLLENSGQTTQSSGNGNQLDKLFNPPHKQQTQTKGLEDTKTDLPNLCIPAYDRFSTTKVNKKQGSNSASQQTSKEASTSSENKPELMGFKGFLNHKSYLQLPTGIYGKIFDFLLKQGYLDWSILQQQIELIRTNNQLSSFIKRIQEINPALKSTFELPDYKDLRESTDSSKSAKELEWLGLKEKKELLKRFIKEHILKTTEQQSSSTSKKENFTGFIWDLEREKEDKKHIFNTNEEHAGATAIYLIQINEENLKNEDSFSKFVSDNLTPELLLKDLVRQAQDVGLQSRAINHYLMRGTWAGGRKVHSLRSADPHFDDQFSSIIL